MPAYFIVEVSVNNTAEYEEYKKMVPDSLTPFGGKFIVRGGEMETLEGDWRPSRMVVLEFPTKELARQWWSSEEYAQAKTLRQRTATTKMILIQGVD